MGNQVGSSSSVLTVQDAKEKITTEEYDRIRRAFHRFKKPQITFDEFNHHILGGAKIPPNVQRSLFKFFSRGSDYLNFDNILCALVGICKAETVQASFIDSFPEFSSWVSVPPRLTVPVDDAYSSFYQVMAMVTHLSVPEVIELEKVFATINDRDQCKISRSTWTDASGGCFPNWFTSRLFDVFDENRNNLIDFREMVCGVSTMCIAPLPSRLSFLAKLWDKDGDNLLSDDELTTMYTELNVPAFDRTIIKSKGDKADLMDFATWVIQKEYANDIVQMGLEMGYICLGLPPTNGKVRLSVVSSFERRVANLNLPVYNIVSSQWHTEWSNTITSKVPSLMPVDNKDIGGIKHDNGPSAQVACLSAESACLRSDITYNDFVAVPPSLWRAFLRWHGSRQNVDGQFTRRFLPGRMFDDGKSQIELFPLDILIMRPDKKKSVKEEFSYVPWAYAQVSRGMTIGELMSLCRAELFLKDAEARLWIMKREPEYKKDSDKLSNVSRDSKDSKHDRLNGENLLLDDDECILYDLGLCSSKEIKLLLEVRDRTTGVWPEEARAAFIGSAVSSARSQNHFSPGAVGLVNTGNFCYRNTAVQCLAKVSPLTEYLLDTENLNKLGRTGESCLANRITLQYALLLKDLWTTNRKNITPVEFNDAIYGDNANGFASGEQHDCQEFVSFLIEQFTKALCETIDSPNGKNISNSSNDIITDEEKATKAWQLFMEQNNSLVSRLFAGQLKSTLICKTCKQSSSHFELFTTLSLSIGFDTFELFQVIVVLRDGSTPTRYGFRLSKSSTVKEFKLVISNASNIPKERIELLCMNNRGNLMDKSATLDDSPITNFPSGARVYAMELPEVESNQIEWIVAIHRKLQYNNEPYFLGASAGFDVNIFGVPLIVPFSSTIPGRKMYEDVNRQIERFMDPIPPALINRAADATENDSSKPPFKLRIVNETLQWCGLCAPLKFCRGCEISAGGTVPEIMDGMFVAVDWNPIALYLRYNHSQETKFVDDASVFDTWKMHYSSFTLDACMKQFSHPAILDDVDCDVCNTKTQRDQVMTIWNLPRYLIIHLKRFEYDQRLKRVVKCKVEVDYPLLSFDPTDYVDEFRGIEGRANYELIAVANHYGELEFGHFLAYGRDEHGKWLEFNDITVKEINADQMDKKNAYLLFYERKDPSEKKGEW